MATLAEAQSAWAEWQRTLALATGGRVFTTHGCSWAWLPARRRVVLLYPQRADDAGLRPGLAEAGRLGAESVQVALNAAADDSALRAFGFREGPPMLWHTGSWRAGHGAWGGRARIGAPVPEASGPDALELQAATAWQDAVRFRVPLRRVEHSVARTGEGALVGRAFGQLTAAGDVSVQGLAVAASYRRRGVGSSLVRSLVDSLGGHDVVAGSGPGAGAFLTAGGLQLIGRGRRLHLPLPRRGG
ncbi:GNAT family N-acetyltransferase [Zafaria sp. Z1313]|uniref:GNAT family N-acetyltransferase n=1 Tax=Zafaria sp. Z1313 TaxID=3423202 RepID=UPI003D30280C